MAKEKEVPKAWKEFMKEAKDAIESGEPLPDFVDRMLDHGFNVTYVRRDLNREKEVFLEVIRYFNKRCGTGYKEDFPSANSDKITARYRENNSVETMKAVINMLACRWQDTEKMATNLAVHIIFDRSKFESYAGQLRPKSRPAPILSAAQTSKPPTAKQPPPPPKQTIEQLIEGDVQFTRELLQGLSAFNSNTKSILVLQYGINILWDYLKRIKKIQADSALFEKASRFAEEKVQQYKNDHDILDTEERRETCRRYYIIKSIIKEQTLQVVQSWVLPEHFEKIHR